VTSTNTSTFTPTKTPIPPTATYTSTNIAGPSAPILRSPTANLLTNVNVQTFTWSNVAMGQSYEIVFADDSAFANIVHSKKVNALFYTPALPFGDGQYYWHVRAYNASNQFGKWSSYRLFTIDMTGPSAPTLNSPINDASSNRTPTFKWLNTPDAVLYEFQYDNDSDLSSPIYTVTVRGTFRKPPAMKPGIYYWHVRAKDASGNWGDWSTPFTITITNP
jgi:hypothetical protein